MHKLYEKQKALVNSTPLIFKRSLSQKIDWNQRLISIRGARGTGKTTLLLQHIKTNYQNDDSLLYASLDNIWFSGHELSELIDDFVKTGGRTIVLDEVHKYKNWSEEIKNAYDNYPELKIIFTGSSLLRLTNAPADLTRRVASYRIQGLSFREFIEYETGKTFPVLTAAEIFRSHKSLSETVIERLRHPIGIFRQYLRTGYYPFYKDSGDLYHDRINDIISHIIEAELPALRRVNPAKCLTIKKLLYLVSESAPYNPNIDELERQIKADKNTVVHYINFLSEADLLKKFYLKDRYESTLKKPDMLQLENTNIAWAIPSLKPTQRQLCLTFLANQLSYENKISVTRDFEIIMEDRLLALPDSGKGGKPAIGNDNLTRYNVIEDLEYGHGNTIPLWLFGFLY
ncbi:MAG TPA: AAA family ATPase [Bacteroidales bacterium]|nr:AAA family ATPase [Bacteroidales bacterium]